MLPPSFGDDLPAGMGRPFRAVSLLLEVRTGYEGRIEVLRIVDFGGDIEPLPPGGILEWLVVLHQMRLDTVGHAVTTQPARGQVARHDRQVATRLCHVDRDATQAASVVGRRTTLKGTGIEAIRLLPHRNRIALRGGGAVIALGYLRLRRD